MRHVLKGAESIVRSGRLGRRITETDARKAQGLHIATHCAVIPQTRAPELSHVMAEISSTIIQMLRSGEGTVNEDIKFLASKILARDFSGWNIRVKDLHVLLYNTEQCVAFLLDGSRSPMYRDSVPPTAGQHTRTASIELLMRLAQRLKRLCIQYKYDVLPNALWGVLNTLDMRAHCNICINMRARCNICINIKDLRGVIETLEIQEVTCGPSPVIVAANAPQLIKGSVIVTERDLDSIAEQIASHIHSKAKRCSPRKVVAIISNMAFVTLVTVQALWHSERANFSISGKNLRALILKVHQATTQCSQHSDTQEVSPSARTYIMPNAELRALAARLRINGSTMHMLVSVIADDSRDVYVSIEGMRDVLQQYGPAAASSESANGTQQQPVAHQEPMNTNVRILPPTNDDTDTVPGGTLSSARVNAICNMSHQGHSITKKPTAALCI